VDLRTTDAAVDLRACAWAPESSFSGSAFLGGILTVVFGVGVLYVCASAARANRLFGGAGAAGHEQASLNAHGSIDDSDLLAPAHRL